MINKCLSGLFESAKGGKKYKHKKGKDKTLNNEIEMVKLIFLIF